MFDQWIAIRQIVSHTSCASSIAFRTTVFCCALVGLLTQPAALSTASAESPQPDSSEGDSPAQTASQSSAAAKQLETWTTEGLPLMQSYCTDCHNADLQEGGLDLSPFETLTDLSTSEVERVLEMVRFGAMPPEDYGVPEIEERKQLVSALEATLHSSTCDLRPYAGNVTVRRLNRSEYNHSIRDLFGMDLRPADRFPSDEVGAGFDNNGDVLSLSPMLIEKYIEAAETVSTQVVIDPDSLEEIDREIPGDQIPIYGEPKIGSFGGRFVDPDSFAWIDLDVPFEGEYRIGVRGGTTSKQHDPVQVGIYDADGILIAHDELKYFGGSGSADSMSETVKLPRGKQRLLIAPVLDDRELVVGETKLNAVESMDPERVKQILAAIGKPVEPTRRIDEDDYPFMFRSFSIDGPGKHPRDAFPPKQFEIVRHVAPKERDRYKKVEETAMKNLREFMPIVFRRPVADEHIAPYAALVKQATDEDKSFHRGMQIALSAVLVSPQFLFRVETPVDGTEPNEFGDYPLSQHQLTTRLSYFLWSSTPDKTLLDQANRNELDEKRLKQNVQRMLKDDRADALASEFAAQWLGLRNLDGHDADGDRFPEFNDSLKTAMRRETEMLFLHVLRNNLSVSEFLTADYSFLNASLAKHYDVDFKGDGFAKVSLADTPRRGLLAHASILTLTSTPNRTSPVLRGKWILENMLGTRPPDPPAGVPELKDTQAAADNATLREQLELHRASPSCASCHRVMDQLGFGLDDFDAVGKFRSEDAGKPIDASGALPDGRSFNGGVELTRMLGETETDALARTLIERLLTFAIGRELTPDDRCTLDEIAAQTKPNDYRLADVVTAVVASRQFRFRTADTHSLSR
ncbi:DUF1592 domain-containing protein [Stieleria tagensis]|uniref:DUF1592 domain-containing protein n=1 Tax=Stieleria tagensis TaxID=2956795 RepID=UPI00209AE314|nr:DUF1592 domain-containing protein [Stieleria tagensis]